ncbi:MAG: hypothetical protein AAEJ57_07455 [Opitutales bacterium]
MMNQHGRTTRELVVVEVELLQFREGEREQEVAFHPAVIDGGAGGVKGEGLTKAARGVGFAREDLDNSPLRGGRPACYAFGKIETTNEDVAQ